MKFEKYPKRTIKNYFLLANEIFLLGLCAEEIAIYSYLLRCENEHYQCWPSYKTIGENVNLCKNTVKKYVNSLCEKQLIDTEYTQIYRGNLKVNGNLKYTIRPIQDAIEYYFQKQFEKNELELQRQRILKMLEEQSNFRPKQAG